MARTVRLSSPGMRAILKSREVADAVSDEAASIAASLSSAEPVQRHGIEVRDYTATTDRAVAGVVLAHPAGARVEAKYGLLVRAARASGLDFRRRS